jgi:hypothetical protein
LRSEDTELEPNHKGMAKTIKGKKSTSYYLIGFDENLSAIGKVVIQEDNGFEENQSATEKVVTQEDKGEMECEMSGPKEGIKSVLESHNPSPKKAVTPLIKHRDLAKTSNDKKRSNSYSNVSNTNQLPLRKSVKQKTGLKGIKGEPKGIKRESKGIKREPKGSKREPKSSKREPRGIKREPKGIIREPRAIKPYFLQDNGEFRCEKCNCIKRTRAAITAHAYIHKELVQCKFCEFKSNKPENMKQHIKCIHDQLRNFECHICNFATPMKTTLAKHIGSVHHKIKEYQCPECEYAAATKVVLALHLKRRHAPKEEIRCPKCEFVAFHAKRLKTHLRKEHGEILPNWYQRDVGFTNAERDIWMGNIFGYTTDNENILQNHIDTKPSH